MKAHDPGRRALKVAAALTANSMSTNAPFLAESPNFANRNSSIIGTSAHATDGARRED
jgi:hypothetical protein